MKEQLKEGVSSVFLMEDYNYYVLLLLPTAKWIYIKFIQKHDSNVIFFFDECPWFLPLMLP